MNKILEKLIYEIQNGTTEIENSEQESINTLIDRYSEDIFEEFLKYVRNDNKYDITFNQYMKETYNHKITKVDNLYFITFYNEGYDEETIRELLKLSNTTDIEEIKKFCDKYNEDDNL